MVSWNLRKEALILLSTMKSEYISMTHTAKEALWIRMFLGTFYTLYQSQYCSPVTANWPFLSPRMIGIMLE